MNMIITPTWVSKDVAVGYLNEVKLVGQFDRSWDDQWRNKPQGAQIGSNSRRSPTRPFPSPSIISSTSGWAGPPLRPP